MAHQFNAANAPAGTAPPTSSIDETRPMTYLRGGGVCLVIDTISEQPRVLHWGRDLGDLDNAALASLQISGQASTLNGMPVEGRFTLVPNESDGWIGTPGLQVSRGGVQLLPRLSCERVARTTEDGREHVAIQLVENTGAFEVTLTFTLDSNGILTANSSLTSMSMDAEPLDVAALHLLMPLPHEAAELLDFSGKWSRERSPQRQPIQYGTHARDIRTGKPGLDSPFLFLAGTTGFEWHSGELWAMHIAWSGDQRWITERWPVSVNAGGTVFGGGELLRAGEVRLAKGECYRAPTIYFTWSGDGIDGVSARFHEHLRSRPSHPRSPRPLVLNSWEAVYFDHQLDRLLPLVDRAASVGVERFVLDDGWFRGRIDDTAGLGDWIVDDRRWPAGLHPLVQRIRAHGMQFGLWLEPEMINLDSELARAHPNWILGHGDGLGMTVRHQYVLNLAHADAWTYLLARIDALISEYAIDYLKWDHNRDLSEAVRRDRSGEPAAVHDQTVALYALLDELLRRHPGLEIESCASGGGRVDLGILQRTDRVWASDCNDPVERQTIQQWTCALLPPELIGTHVAAPRAHTTGRVTDLPFRLSTALFGHAGIEWDLTTCADEELTALRSWSAMYREFRDLLHTGRVVHAELEAEAVILHGVVAHDASHALYEWVQLTSTSAGQIGRVRIPGLDVARWYEVRVRTDFGAATLTQGSAPTWYTQGLDQWVRVHGAVIAAAGLPMPALNPAQSALLEFRAVRALPEGAFRPLQSARP